MFVVVSPIAPAPALIHSSISVPVQPAMVIAAVPSKLPFGHVRPRRLAFSGQVLNPVPVPYPHGIRLPDEMST